MQNLKTAREFIVVCQAILCSFLLVGCEEESATARRGGGSSVVSVAPPASVSMVPPASLTLDGQLIVSGRFVVVEATAYLDGEAGETRSLVTSAAPRVVDATIGQGNHNLFETPSNTAALAMRGYFDATNPDLPPANYDLTVFGDFSLPLRLTVFLPAQTSTGASQVTVASPEAAAVQTSYSDAPLPAAAIRAAIASRPSGQQVSLGTPPLNFPRSTVFMVSHGTLGITPPAPAGFDCSSGASIDRTLVCNSISDCPAGDDENPSMCGDDASCCVATNGCPQETGGSCGGTCCCCGGGEACDQSDPSIGCVAAP